MAMKESFFWVKPVREIGSLLKSFSFWEVKT